mgnify:CR=1 FL=1
MLNIALILNVFAILACIVRVAIANTWPELLTFGGLMLFFLSIFFYGVSIISTIVKPKGE